MRYNPPTQVLIVLIGILVLLIMVVTMVMQARSAETPPPCMDADTREQVRGIMMDGVVLGLKEHANHLFDIWIKDGSGQPERAAIGMHNGVRAFLRAKRDIENWDPPQCKGDKQ
jgi:hypothetical protein